MRATLPNPQGAMMDSQVQALAIGDRFRNVLQIGELLGQIDLSLVDDIARAGREAAAAVGTEAKLTAWLNVAKLTAAATKFTEADDQVVAIAEQILSGPLKDLLVAIVDRLVASRPAMVEGESYTLFVESLTLEEQETFKAAGINPAIVIAIVDMILKFWRNRNS